MLNLKRNGLIGLLGGAVLMAGCFFPPPGPNPPDEEPPEEAPAALEVSEVTITPNCDMSTLECEPTVSGTVTNTGELPTAGPVTVSVYGVSRLLAGGSVAHGPIPATCSSEPLAGGSSCTFTTGSIGTTYMGYTADLGVDATDGVIDAPTLFPSKYLT